MTGPADRKGWSNRAVVTVLAACAALAIGLFAFFRLNWHPYSIPAASMEPTLLVGDHMLAENGPFAPEEIGRGEVVVFLNEDDVSFVKRVIGIGGDTVQLVNGAVLLNGEALAAEPIGEFEAENHFGAKTSVPLVRETLDGRTYETLDAVADGAGDNTRPFSVPEGHVFVLGDNRDNSNDSRYGIGFVPVDQIVGIARTIYRSPKRGGGGLFDVR